MLRIVREYRREIERGAGRPEYLDFSDTLRYVVLLGIRRQPVLFLAGPFVAAGSIVIMAYRALESIAF